MAVGFLTRASRDGYIWVLPVIAAFSIYNLWVRMLLNGTLDAISDAKANKILPGGDPLVSVFTGIPLIDGAISTLTIFFHPLLSHTNPSGRVVMIDVLVLLHSALLWLVIDSRRQRETPWALKMTALTGLLWNAAGAAIILPLYVLASFWNGPRPSAPLSLANAKSLLPSLVLASYLPMAYAWAVPLMYASDPAMVQKTTAMLQIGPVFFVVGHTLLSLVLPQLQGKCQREDDMIAQWWVKCSYLTTAAVCAFVHVASLGTIAFARADSGVSFAAVFWPKPDAVDGLRDGTMLFMQYDNIFISITCVFWALLVIRERAPRMKRQTMGTLLALCAMCLVFGPGAIMGLTFFFVEGASGSS